MSNEPRPPRSPMQEVVSRARRIETRMTQLMLALGVDTQAQKPMFSEGNNPGTARVQLPSPHSSLKEILDSIPDKWDGFVEVFVGDEYVTTLDCSD